MQTAEPKSLICCGAIGLRSAPGRRRGSWDCRAAAPLRAKLYKPPPPRRGKGLNLTRNGSSNPVGYGELSTITPNSSVASFLPQHFPAVLSSL